MVGKGGLLDVPLQTRPARKSVFAGDRKLRIAELQLRFEDFGVARFAESRMEFADLLGHSHLAGSMLLQKVFGLMFEVVETRMVGEPANGHDELPFVCPGPHLEG